MGTALIIQIALLVYSYKQYVTQRKLETAGLPLNGKDGQQLTDSSNPDLLESLETSQTTDPTSEAVPLHGPLATIEDTSVEEGSYKVHREAEETAICRQTYLRRPDMVFLALFVLLAPAFEFVRGNKSTKSVIGNQVCTTGDFGLLAGYFALLAGLSAYLRVEILARNRVQELDEHSMRITEESSLWFMTTIFMVSLVGGFVSSGSSTLITIAIIAFGLRPFSASSTGMVIVIIFSGSSAAIFFLDGSIFPACALIGGGVVVFSTLLTRMTVYESFVKHGRASLVLLFISLMMVITIPSNIWQVAPHIKAEYDKGKNIFAFDSFCK